MKEIQQGYVAGFEDGRRDPEPRNAGGLQKLAQATKVIPPWRLQKEAALLAPLF